MDLWQAPIIPIVDLNSDGIVDAFDRGIMMDHWGEDYPLCDIGPMPWGDGIVDIQDLLVLAEYLEPLDTLIAHWALNETEGIMAHDSVSGNDDIIMGDPLWQPTGGKVDGALELDGVTNCIITATGPNPAEGPFSIFAWIKGGAPGQVIISQPLGSNWLGIDADGTLMTDEVRYALPFGPLGRLAHLLWVGRQLKGIFDYRAKKIAEMLDPVHEQSKSEVARHANGKAKEQ